MLHTRTGTEYRAGTAATIPPTILDVDRFAEESNERRGRLAAERAIDECAGGFVPGQRPSIVESWDRASESSRWFGISRSAFGGCRR